MTPICKFCGQAVITELPENCSQFQAEEIASENCSCAGAQDYRKKQKAKRDAQTQIGELFGSCAGAETVEFLKSATELLQNGEIEKLTVGINLTTVAEVKIDAKGKYSVTKTVTIKNKRETD